MRRIVAVVLAGMMVVACEAKPPTAEDVRTRRAVEYVNCYPEKPPCR